MAKPKSQKARAPGTLDKHIGARMRRRRLMLGIGIEELADRVGLTFQQVDHFERGEQRVSASQLYLISLELKVPYGYFFETETGHPELPDHHLLFNLLRGTAAIKNERHQEAVCGLVRALAARPEPMAAE